MTILQAKQRLHEKWMQLTKDGTDEEMMQALGIVDTVLGNYDEALKADLVAMLTEIQLEIEETEPLCNECDYAIDDCTSKSKVNNIIQQKIDLLQKQTTDNCDNCFNGTTKGGCAVKELMKNKDCKYYMPRENQCFERQGRWH